MVSIPIRGGQTSNKLRLQPLNPTQHWSCWRPWGCPTPAWGSQEVDLPRDPVPRRLLPLSLLRDPPAWGPRRSTCLNLPGPWEVVMPQPAQRSASSGVPGVNMPQPDHERNSQEADMPTRFLGGIIKKWLWCKSKNYTKLLFTLWNSGSRFIFFFLVCILSVISQKFPLLLNIYLRASIMFWELIKRNIKTQDPMKPAVPSSKDLLGKTVGFLWLPDFG